MSKTDYTLSKISKEKARFILDKFHYLKDISKGFKSGYNYGIYHKSDGDLVGVVIYTGLPVPEIMQGCFGLDRLDQDGFFELSRLCLDPYYQGKEHNLTSWFVSRSIKMLKNETNVRAILSYADNDHHRGIIYRACNFKYYGLTDAKKDFWFKKPNGEYVKHSRGKMKGHGGEWRDRSRKHRYLMVFDKSLNVKWAQKKWH